MDSRQFKVLLELMDRIDRGEQPPSIPGPYGGFLRGYARERNDVVTLALERGIEIRRDGTISGRPFGRISVSPLFPSDSSQIADSHWGRVGRYLVLCPELMTAVVLRVWLSGQSGRDAFRELEGSSAALLMYGDFRWLPPGFVTTGTADFEKSDASIERWEDAPYLKITGDDLSDIPHALDHLDVYLNGRSVLAHIRTALIVRRSDGRLFVPGALRRIAPPLTVINPRKAEELMGSQGELFLGLIYREPGEQSWHVWRVTPVDAREGLRHNLEWVRFARFLCGESVTHDVLDAAANGLEHAGVSVDRRDLPNVDPAREPESPLANFARAILREMRVSRN